MVQYQCVIPEQADPATFRRLLEVVSRMGGASPVSVIKDCGREGRGMLSFPMAGMSLALDLSLLARTASAIFRRSGA